MINVVSIEVNSARLRMAEDGLKRLSEVIGVMMANMPAAGRMAPEEEEQAERTAAEYLCIGAAACHLMADTIETLERRGQDG